MFASLISKKATEISNDEIISKRRFIRRKEDKCVTIIDGTPYPVENWSLGGVLLQADSRVFSIGQQNDVTLKFKLRDRLVDIPHRATVVRKSRDTVALQFDPLTKQTKTTMQNIIGEFVTKNFADSQRV